MNPMQSKQGVPFKKQLTWYQAQRPIGQNLDGLKQKRRNKYASFQF